MKKFYLAALVALMAQFAAAAQIVTITVPSESSADIYISPTGSDSASCSKSAPCKSVSVAMQKSGSGKNVWCTTGTYTLPSAITGVPSGSASSRIYFGPASGQSCTFSFPSGGTRFDGMSYWTFHDATYKAIDRGFVFGLTNGLAASTNMQFYRNTMQQTTNSDSSCGGSNCGLIYVEPINSNPDYFDIVQNDINAKGTGSTNENNGGLFFFRYPMHMNIVGNTIHDIPEAIRYKFDHNATSSSQVSLVIANNIIWNGDLNTQASWAQIYNNVFANNSILIGNNGGIQGGKYTTFNHNTFHTEIILVAPGGDSNCNVCNITLTNNVFSGSPQYQQLEILPWVSGTEPLTHDYNYWTSSAQILVNSTVTSILSLVTGVTGEAHGIRANASYASTLSSSPQLASSWTISNPATGSDGLSMGAIAANLLTTNSLGSTTSTSTTANPPSSPSIIQITPQ